MPDGGLKPETLAAFAKFAAAVSKSMEKQADAIAKMAKFATSSAFLVIDERHYWEPEVRAEAAEWLTTLLATRGPITMYVAQLAWRRRWRHLRYRISWPELIDLAHEMEFIRGNCWALPEDHPLFDPRQRPRVRRKAWQSFVSAGGITSGRSTPYPTFPTRGAIPTSTITRSRSSRRAGPRRMR